MSIENKPPITAGEILSSVVKGKETSADLYALIEFLKAEKIRVLHQLLKKHDETGETFFSKEQELEWERTDEMYTEAIDTISYDANLLNALEILMNPRARESLREAAKITIWIEKINKRLRFQFREDVPRSESLKVVLGEIPAPDGTYWGVEDFSAKFPLQKYID